MQVLAAVSWLTFMALLTVGLCLEDGIHFQLSPHQIATLLLVCNAPPEPPSEDTFEEVRIIAGTYVGLKGSLSAGTGHKESIGIVDLPQEIVIERQLFFILLIGDYLFGHAEHERIFLDVALLAGQNLLEGKSFGLHSH